MHTPRHPTRSITIMASALLALFLLSFVLGRYGVPQEAVDERKQRQLARIAQDYLAAHHLENAPARFDVIAVTLDREDQPARIDHIDNAFELSE